MQKNEAFPEPICTPTTKASIGHDANISRADIVARGLATSAIYEAAEDLAFRMFTYGQAVARERGLILVDTKYEMGLTESGDLIVIDEVHTPDSSRYWIADSYASRIVSGSEPESLDKEFVRRMIIDQGYDVDSPVDPGQFFSDKIRLEAGDKYADLYAKVTGDGVVIRNTNVDEIESTLGLIARGGDLP
jgi:phosphoribosylaminoimidazole-succinocarboxamide synthase